MNKILQERQSTHGCFYKNAMMSQKLKVFFRDCEGWQNMTACQKESFDMIALKMSRILSGQSQFKDHWDDISGYATLGTPDERQ